MRCLSCDRRLNDRESVRRYASSGDFIDLCDRCFSYISEEVPDIGIIDDNEGTDITDDTFNPEDAEDSDYNHFINFSELNGDDFNE